MNAADAIEQYWKAWNAHDLDAMVALVDDEIDFQFPTDAEPERGKERLRNVWSALISDLVPDIGFDVVTTVVQDRMVACEYVEHGTFGGRRYAMPMASFVLFSEEGVMVRLRAYWDTAALAQQTGVGVDAIGSIHTRSIAEDARRRAEGVR